MATYSIQTQSLHLWCGHWLGEHRVLRCSLQIQEILMQSKEISTRKTFSSKWKRFFMDSPTWAGPTLKNLNYLLCLMQTSLLFSSVLRSISQWSLFAIRLYCYTQSLLTPRYQSFIKGYYRFIHHSENQLLPRLQYSPPEAQGASIQTSVSLLLTSPHSAVWPSQWLSLQALAAELSHMIFHKDKVVPRPHPNLIPKVVSEFHLNQPISLPVCFLKPCSALRETLQTLGVSRTLLYWWDRAIRTVALFISLHSHVF